MNAAPNKTRTTAADYRARARARRADDATQARRAVLAGRTLETTPAADLSPAELRARIETTARAFEGL